MAVALADRVGDHEQACWSALRLMDATAEAYGEDAAFAALNDVRARVVRLGSAHAVCALHVFVGEIETKRGYLDNADRHLAIARTILDGEPNLWLEGLVAVARFCVSYLRSDVAAAYHEAHQALRITAVSGHAITKMASLVNLGHIELMKGDLAAAERWLRRAEENWAQGGGGETAIADGLAQVHLARGERDKCQEILARAEIGQNLENVTHYQAWSIPTRVRLLLLQGQPEAAGALADAGITIARKRGARSLVQVLRLLRCDAEVALERISSAIESVLTGEGSATMSARIACSLARLHEAAVAEPGHAVDWFHRAERLFASTSDEYGRAEVLDDYADFLWERMGKREKGEPCSSRSAPALRTLPANVSFHQGGATAIGPTAAPPQNCPFSVLHQSTAVVELRGKTRAIAFEAFELLRALPGVTACAIVLQSEAGTPEILRFAGDYRAACALAGSGGTADRIHVGPWRNGRLEVVVDAGGDVAIRCAASAVRRLVGAAEALETADRERRERVALWPIDDPATSPDGVFACQVMTELLATARKVAGSNVTVLITGESGTGKEVLARVIHQASPRASQRFIPFNCTAVPREMLDSQLFGYRRGAFTGASTHFPGVIRSAAGGTLLLDEIGEVSLELQPKLLRFLDAQEIQPLGEAQPVAVDVRVIAATNANLEQMMAAGRFREDLYYRLNVIRLRIPPLRERREEIPVLVQHFLDRFTREYNKQHVRIAEETMEYLLLYSWPGNVRELLNQMRRLAALAENGAVLMPEHLAPEITAARRTVPASERTLAPSEVVVRLDQPLAAAVEHMERALIPYAVRTAGGHMEVAARMLGLSRKGLYLKRQRLGLDRGEEQGIAEVEA